MHSAQWLLLIMYLNNLNQNMFSGVIWQITQRETNYVRSGLLEGSNIWNFFYNILWFLQMGDRSTRETVSRLSLWVLQNEEICQKFLGKCQSEMNRKWQNYTKINMVSKEWQASWIACTCIKKGHYSLCGQHVGKDGFPMLVVEASCNYNLFFEWNIWSCRSIKQCECLKLQSIAQISLDGTFPNIDLSLRWMVVYSQKCIFGQWV